MRNFDDLLLGLYTARAGDHSEVSTADFDRTNRYHRIIGVKLTTDLLEGFRNMLQAFHNIHGSQQVRVNFIRVANETQNGDTVAGIGMDLHPQGFQPTG